MIRFNAGHVGDKLSRLAAAMALPKGADVAQAIADLNGRLGLPAGLQAMGVPRSVLQSIAEAAPKDHCHGTNPRVAQLVERSTYTRLVLGSSPSARTLIQAGNSGQTLKYIF